MDIRSEVKHEHFEPGEKILFAEPLKIINQHNEENKDCDELLNCAKLSNSISNTDNSCKEKIEDIVTSIKIEPNVDTVDQSEDYRSVVAWTLDTGNEKPKSEILKSTLNVGNLLENKTLDDENSEREEITGTNSCRNKRTKKTYSCSLCNYTAGRRYLFNRHIMVHSSAKLFKCPDCSYECNRKDNLTLHLLKHSDTKLFKCTNCSYECNQKCDLKRHLLTHTNIKLFKCFECNYACNQNGNLKRHLLTHISAKLFKCPQCDYECNQKASLKVHFLSHSNQKLFRCSECAYECNRKGDLKSHMLVHSSAKLFRCDECQYRCNQKRSLRSHLLSHLKDNEKRKHTLANG